MVLIYITNNDKNILFNADDTCKYSYMLNRGAVVVVIDRSWIYDYLCNQCLSSLTLRVRISLRRGALVTALCDKVYPWLLAGRWFSSVSPTNKTHNHDITEILLKVALNTITLTLYVFRLWTVFKGDRIVLYNMCCCVFPLHCMLILCCFINI
jgi:hypothetical protein